MYNTGLKALTKTAFPLLEAIGGTLLVAHNNALETAVSFPLLHAVRGLVNVNNNPKLKEFVLPELQHVEDNFEVKANAELEKVSVPKLKAVNKGVDFESNNQLRDVDLALLHTVDDKFRFQSNKQITKLEVPELRRVGASLYFDSNQMMDIISMPNLAETGTVQVRFFLVNSRTPMGCTEPPLEGGSAHPIRALSVRQQAASFMLTCGCTFRRRHNTAAAPKHGPARRHFIPAAYSSRGVLLRVLPEGH